MTLRSGRSRTPNGDKNESTQRSDNEHDQSSKDQDDGGGHQDKGSPGAKETPGAGASDDPKKPSTEPPSTKFRLKLFRAMAVLVVIVAVAVAVMCKRPESSDDSKPRKSALAEYFKKIQYQFPSQTQKCWGKLISGANDFINNTERPLIVLMNGHKDTQNCLGQMYLETMNKTVVMKDASQLQAEDYGEIIVDMKNSVQDNGGLLIKNLEGLDVKLALALHSICDRVTPLTGNLIVVMTTEKPLDEIVASWSSHLEEDIIAALKIRLMDRVVNVNPEETLPCALK